MKGIRQLLIASFLVLGPIQLVLADPFINNDSSESFHSHLDDFGKSLENAGQQMRNDSDYSSMQQSQRYFADQQTLQQGTQAAAQQSFMNGQMQASYGGASGYANNYGNNGLFGNSMSPMGIGGFGIGNNSFTVGGNQTATNGNFNTTGGTNYGSAYQSGYATGYSHGSNNGKYDSFGSLGQAKSTFSPSKTGMSDSPMTKF